MLSNYSMVNYDSLNGQILHFDDNYPCTVPTCLLILIAVLDTLITATIIVAYCYCRYR